MNKYVEVMAIVEGRTEQTFIQRVLAPYLEKKNIFISATQISKSGDKGGDVKFSRVQRDIGNFLKLRKDIYVTVVVDYYGLKEWPNLDNVAKKSHRDIARLLNESASQHVKQAFSQIQVDNRFIPYMTMHEFEALLFSDIQILADALEVEVKQVEEIIKECGEPEKINNSPETAPSKRLDKLKKHGKFRKTSEGIDIAEKIGIDTIRQSCPLFDDWLKRLESKIK